MADPLRFLTEQEYAVEFARQRQVRVDRFFNRLLLNPDPPALIGLVQKSRDYNVRGLLIHSEMYWWDSELATHAEGRRWLDHDPNAIELEAFAAYCDDHTYDPNQIYLSAVRCIRPDGVTKDDALDLIRNLPQLQGYVNEEGLLSPQRGERQDESESRSPDRIPE